MQRATRFFLSGIITVMAIIPSDGFSQGIEHTTLVGQLAFEFTSDIWGYTDSTTGIDYALLGTFGGMAIIDATTDTTNPTQVAFVSGVSSTWKDIKTWKNYSYLVSEGGGGLEIVNLTDPTNPIVVKNVTTNFTRAHNLYIDENGFAYVVGANFTSSGLIIYDLSDPENPVKTGQWAGDYIHDVFVRDNVAWASAIGRGSIIVIDVSDKTTPTEMTRWFEGFSTHHAWLTDDSNYLLVTEERIGGHLKIWDVRDLNNITKVSEYESKPNIIIHNVFVKGDFAYISYYVEGLKIVDISDPTSPGEVGGYDIFPGPDFAGFNGSWGVFPYTSSGLVFIGDTGGSFTTVRFDGAHASQVKGTVKDNVTGSPITGATINVLETNTIIHSDDSGIYKYATLRDSITLIGDNYGYFPDTSSVTLISGDTVFNDILLGELPKSSITGVITDSLSGLPIQADIILGIESDARFDVELEASTDASGAFSFDSLYISYKEEVVYRYLVVLPEFPYPPYIEEFVAVTEGAPTVMNVTMNPADILLYNADKVDDYAEYYLDPLDSIGITFHFSDKNNGDRLPVSRMNELNYPVAIWFTGDIADSVMTVVDEDSIMSFLDSGGRLFLTGQNIVENLSPSSRFLTDYLQVSHGGEPPIAIAREVGFNPVTTGVGRFALTGLGGANNQTSLDILVPTGESVPALYYNLSGESVAAVSRENTLTGSKLFLAGFGFEGVINDNVGFSKPYDLMARVLNWFDMNVVVTGTEGDDRLLPDEFSLKQNYPNPFNPETRIEFRLLETGMTRLIIFDLRGREVARLINREMEAGIHNVSWNASNVPSGIYFYRLTSGTYAETRKMMLLK